MAGLHSYSSPEDSSGKSNIAFFATVGAKRRGKTGAGQIIVFEQVVTNVGSAYNADHGFFTAPMPGLYQFSSTIMADNGKEVWARLCLNNKPVAYIYARATNDRHDQGSQTIILQLKKGDIVCVQNQHETSIYGDTYTCFSGFLIG